jgi:ankyrin repeat protein
LASLTRSHLGATDTWGNTPLHSRAAAWNGSISILLELGADVNATTASIGTPLHAAADRKQPENARLLLTHGAIVDARNKEALTPLELALRGCTNSELERMPALVKLLLDAGATRTPPMKDFVHHLGETFEFHRQAFNPDRVAAADSALNFLYAAFDVTPVAKRHIHDGAAPIVPKTTTWQQQHAELWQLLVPSGGSAKTVQGEVIRISGRISDEWERNGGTNWDADYKKMAAALVRFVQRGTPLEQADIAAMKSIVSSISRQSEEETDRLAEFAVDWVLRNPQPIILEKPDYQR